MSIQRTTSMGWANGASWLALGVAIAVFALRGPAMRGDARFWDYAVYGSSAYEWAHGRDPYDQAAVNASWASRGPRYGVERDLSQWQAIAPPWTLAALSPFATLPPAVGAYFYLGVAAALNAWAAVRCARWAQLPAGSARRFYASALLVSVPLTLGLSSGNPIVLAAPLVLIGLAESADGRGVRGGLLLGLGAAFKFQIGLPMLAFWLACGRWRPSAIAIATFALLAILGLARPGVSGIDAWHGWVANVASANGPGGVNDFSTARSADDHLDLLVPLWRLTQDRTLTKSIVAALWLTIAVPFAGWLARARSAIPERRETTLAAIGLAALLSVIPIYHRTYDALLFFPIVALAIRLAATGERRRLGWLTVLLLAPLVIPSGLPVYFERRGRVPSWVVESTAYRAAIVPVKAWATSALALPMLRFVWRLDKNRRRGEKIDTFSPQVLDEGP